MRHASNSATPFALPRLLVLLVALLVLVGLGFAVLPGLLSPGGSQGQPPGSAPAGPGASGTPEPAETAPDPTTPPAPPEPVKVSFTILAGGDVLPHSPVHESARVAGGGYDFSPLLAGLDPWVSRAGLALCHMEVPFAPDGQAISGYPMFAASPDLAQDLLEQGWDGCSTASNHSVDRQFAGVEKTLNRFDEVGLGHVGTARTEAESKGPQLFTVTIDGVDTVVAHLSATYGLNGLPMPAEAPWAVQMIDTDQLISQARTARKAGADLVLVSIHAGTEYRTAPTDEQVQIAEALAASGEVDLLIGHHAHVPQPMTKLDGGPGDAGMWVAYGLGNMISNQGAHCCAAESDSGLLLSAQATHVGGEPARITGLEWVGITVDRLGGHRVHAFADILDQPGGVGKLSSAEIRTRYNRVADAVGSEIPERTKPAKKQKTTVKVHPR